MRTFATVQGLPVIHVETGEEYGRVIDLLICNNHIVFFLINMKGWFNKHHVLPLKDGFKVGAQAIMIKSKGNLKVYLPQPDNQHSHHLALGRSKLKGMELFSEHGDMLGLIEDVYFSEEMGMIEGYKVTDGLLADLTQPPKMVKGQQLVIGKERAILSQ